MQRKLREIVSRVLSSSESLPTGKDFNGGDHSSGTFVTERLKRLTRKLKMKADQLPYLVLLQVGFAAPPMSPWVRGALTSPFHPYPVICRAVYFLLHFPSLLPHGKNAWPLTSTLLSGARTFLQNADQTAFQRSPIPRSLPISSKKRFVAPYL